MPHIIGHMKRDKESDLERRGFVTAQPTNIGLRNRHPTRASLSKLGRLAIPAAFFEAPNPGYQEHRPVFFRAFFNKTEKRLAVIFYRDEDLANDPDSGGPAYRLNWFKAPGPDESKRKIRTCYMELRTIFKSFGYVCKAGILRLNYDKGVLYLDVAKYLTPFTQKTRTRK